MFLSFHNRRLQYIMTRKRKIFQRIQSPSFAGSILIGPVQIPLWTELFDLSENKSPMLLNVSYRAILWIVIVSNTCFCLHAQAGDKWQRVYTGDDSVIDINMSSSTLEAEHVLRVDFRTTLAKPENIAGNGSAKYKSRIETISFKLNQNRYRLAEVVWFDSKGAKLNSYSTSADDWRVLKYGGVMEKMFNSAGMLPPFGSWKVVACKFADGGANPEPQFIKLVGTRVWLQPERAQVGERVCSSLAYEDKRASREEMDRLGVKLEPLGIAGDYVETTNLKCEGGGWAPRQSLLLKMKEDEMLMLWSGVFLVLKR